MILNFINNVPPFTIEINFDFNEHSHLIKALEPETKTIEIPEVFPEYQINLFKEILEKIDSKIPLSLDEKHLANSSVLIPLVKYFDLDSFFKSQCNTEPEFYYVVFMKVITDSTDSNDNQNETEILSICKSKEQAIHFIKDYLITQEFEDFKVNVSDTKKTINIKHDENYEEEYVKIIFDISNKEFKNPFEIYIESEINTDEFHENVIIRYQFSICKEKIHHFDEDYLQTSPYLNYPIKNISKYKTPTPVKKINIKEESTELSAAEIYKTVVATPIPTHDGTSDSAAGGGGAVASD